MIDLLSDFCFIEAAQRNGLVIATKTPTVGGFTLMRRPLAPPGLTTSPQTLHPA